MFAPNRIANAAPSSFPNRSSRLNVFWPGFGGSVCVTAATDKEVRASNAQSTRLKSYLTVFEIVIELVILTEFFAGCQH